MLGYVWVCMGMYGYNNTSSEDLQQRKQWLHLHRVACAGYLPGLKKNTPSQAEAGARELHPALVCNGQNMAFDIAGHADLTSLDPFRAPRTSPLPISNNIPLKNGFLFVKALGHSGQYNIWC